MSSYLIHRLEILSIVGSVHKKDFLILWCLLGGYRTEHLQFEYSNNHLAQRGCQPLRRKVLFTCEDL